MFLQDDANKEQKTVSIFTGINCDSVFSELDCQSDNFDSWKLPMPIPTALKAKPDGTFAPGDNPPISLFLVVKPPFTQCQMLLDNKVLCTTTGGVTVNDEVGCACSTTASELNQKGKYHDSS